MAIQPRRRAAGALFAVGALCYAWFATGVRSFTPSAYVFVAVPSLGALLLYGVLGGFSPIRTEVTNYYRVRASLVSWQRAAPWLVAAVLALALESAGLALGGRSVDVPTLSTTVDHLVVDHGGRFVLFVLWLAVGANPLRRLFLVQHGTRT
jgi:hypothetical protein